jgi:hypothetical protein
MDRLRRGTCAGNAETLVVFVPFVVFVSKKPASPPAQSLGDLGVLAVLFLTLADAQGRERAFPAVLAYIAGP